jgi:ATP-dependent Zn protease
MAHVLQLLQNKRPVLDRIATVLLEKEVLEGPEFETLLQEAAPQVA